MRIGAIYTEKKQSVLRGSLEKYVNDKRDLMTLSPMAQEYPDSFFGIGGNTRVEDEEIYFLCVGNPGPLPARDNSAPLRRRSRDRLSRTHIASETRWFLASATDQNQNRIQRDVTFSLRGVGA
jgi:hypothetical protein